VIRFSTLLRSIQEEVNWIFFGFIILSLAIHSLVFLKISDLYQTRSRSYIEVSVADNAPPPSRHIPRPRLRPRERSLEVPPVIAEKQVRHNILPITDFNKILSEIPPVADISVPDVSKITSMKVSDWLPVKELVAGDFQNRNDYFEMVRMKIERSKVYPVSALKRDIIGRVVLKFQIEGNGDISGLLIVENSGHKVLDDAALKAVQEASPFSRPPGNLFGKSPIEVKIPIVFELIR